MVIHLYHVLFSQLLAVMATSPVQLILRRVIAGGRHGIAVWKRTVILSTISQNYTIIIKIDIHVVRKNTYITGTCTEALIFIMVLQ